MLTPLLSEDLRSWKNDISIDKSPYNKNWDQIAPAFLEMITDTSIQNLASQLMLHLANSVALVSMLYGVISSNFGNLSLAASSPAATLVYCAHASEQHISVPHLAVCWYRSLSPKQYLMSGHFQGLQTFIPSKSILQQPKYADKLNLLLRSSVLFHELLLPLLLFLFCLKNAASDLSLFMLKIYR